MKNTNFTHKLFHVTRTVTNYSRKRISISFTEHINCILFLGIYSGMLKIDYISIIFVVNMSL